MKNREHYPDNWEDTIRPAILKRDAYKCQICGANHRAIGYYSTLGTFLPCDEFMQDWAKRTGQKTFTMHLQVAHRNHDKKDCRPENLQAMCPRCHLNYDRSFNSLLRKMRGRQGGSNGGRKQHQQGTTPLCKGCYPVMYSKRIFERKSFFFDTAGFNPFVFQGFTLLLFSNALLFPCYLYYNYFKEICTNVRAQQLPHPTYLK